MVRRAIHRILLVTALALMVAESDASAADPVSGENRQGYLIGGTVLFAVPYLASDAVGLTYAIGRNVSCTLNGGVEVAAIAGASTTRCPNLGYGWLTIPFAGPFISLAAYRQGTAAAIALTADGAAQLAGAALFIIGLVHHEERPPGQAASWDIVPGPSGALAGVGLRIRGF